MDKQQGLSDEKSVTQKFGEAVRATRDRHAREINSIACKGMDISREQLRKLEMVDKTAPAVIIRAMEKRFISIHKAYELNKSLQKIPEDDRETYAVLALEKILVERESGTFKLRQISNRISKIISIASKNEKFLTTDNLDIYLNYSGLCLSDIADIIDDEIFALSKFKLIVQKRRQGID